MHPRTILSLFMAIATIGAFGAEFKNRGIDFEEAAFSTPEEAIDAYFEGLKNLDLGAMLATSDIDESSANFDFEKYADRLKSIVPQSLAPTKFDFFRQINRAKRVGQFVDQIKYLAYGLLSSKKNQEFWRAVPLSGDASDPEYLDRFLTDLDPRKLADLKVAKILLAAPQEIMTGHQMTAMWGAEAAIYGASGITERLAFFSVNGRYFFNGFHLLRYGNGWKIGSASSILANTEATGAAREIGEAEFNTIMRTD